jgi:hypothetical protein
MTQALYAHMNNKRKKKENYLAVPWKIVFLWVMLAYVLVSFITYKIHIVSLSQGLEMVCNVATSLVKMV